MTDLTQELRVKVSDEMHRHIHAFALAYGEDAAALVRQILHGWIEGEVRKHTLIARLLKGEGMGGECEGSRK